MFLYESTAFFFLNTMQKVLERYRLQFLRKRCVYQICQKLGHGARKSCLPLINVRSIIKVISVKVLVG